MAITFGSFDGVCETAALVVCPLLGPDQGIEPVCYSRNVDIGGTLVFQPSTCFVHVVAIFMTAIMIYHIRSKYTAVGRREIVMFFYLYAIIELLAFFLDSNIIPAANPSYPWFAAVYTGLVAAAYTCLLINGFVGFQFAEDGTPLSLWFLRISMLLVFGVTMFVAIATFQSFAGFKASSPLGLWIIYLLWPIICAAVYTVSQLVLVFRTLDDRWPLGDIVFGAAFFTIAQVILFAFSTQICDAIKHYIDGLFFFHLCMLLSVMMVYKYWDSITKEDLEFSVGSKQAVWEVKDPLLAGNGANGEYDEDGSSGFHSSQGAFQAPGGYGGGAAGVGYGGAGNPSSLVGGGSGQQTYGQQQGGKAGYGAPGQRGYPPSGY